MTLVAQEVKGGAAQPYAGVYRTAGLKHPIYQLMASGMTDSTARKASCGGWRKDGASLRCAPPTRCGVSARRCGDA